jgi:hypothetical protein
MSANPSPLASQPAPTIKKAEAWIEKHCPTAATYMKAYGKSAAEGHADPTSIPDPFTTNSMNFDPHFSKAISSTIKSVLKKEGPK